MAALSFARRGKNVVVVSELKSWGGSWQYLNYMGETIDTSCHLLESYKIVHHILRRYNINLTACIGPLAPIKLLPSKDGNSFRVESYHSRINIAREAQSRVLILCKILMLLMLEPLSSTKLDDLTQSFSDFLLFIRYRLIQILFLEPVCRPVGGWPSLIKELTSQLEKENITVVDDRAMTIIDDEDFSSVVLRSSPSVKADLVVSGQSTLLNLSASNLSSRAADKATSITPSVYTHFLVEVINLSSKQNFPFYIHLPLNEAIHRVTYSHTSSSSLFFLVQVRRDDIPIGTLINSIKAIFRRIINLMPERSVYSSTCTESLLEVRIHDRFTPKALQHAFSGNVKPGLTGRHMILRTYGDLARNIAHHSPLFA
jgi:hypothetical protein